MRKFLFPIALGVAGCALLLGLCIWQVQRLQWKTAILADIDARITAAPVSLPAAPDPQADRYLPVTVAGAFSGDPIFVLVTPDGLGPGYRYIRGFRTGDRVILADLGWVPLVALDYPPNVPAEVQITGNLHWPDEVDGWTPDPDPRGIWFARDVGAMAAALGTEPTLVIARTIAPQSAPFQPLPLDSSGIKNDHLTYAITWAALALVWVLMTGFWIARLNRKDG